MSAAELIKRLRKLGGSDAIAIAHPGALFVLLEAADALEAHATRIASLEARVAEYVSVGWQHRRRKFEPSQGGWTEWREGKANLSEEMRESFHIEEREIFTRLALKGSQHDRD